MHILVTGGAGYIGSHTVRYLLDQGEDVTVVDNLETGHKEAVDKRAHFYNVDIRDSEEIENIFTHHKITSVIHFAANSLVGESMQYPLKYYENNLHSTQKLLESMQKTGINNLVFSSSAAIYGEPAKTPIDEDADKQPTNTYGETKLAMERMIKWVGESSKLRYVSLRYFNVAGAWLDGSIGEDHATETHLIPIILQVPLGKRSKLHIYGNDYPTPDGSCIRDYIHVIDLAKAHYLALKYLVGNGKSAVFNLGSESGYSVFKMHRAAESITGKTIPFTISQRRHGDPAKLVASSKKIKQILKWEPEYTNVENIISSAYLWHKNNPEGYHSNKK